MLPLFFLALLSPVSQAMVPPPSFSLVCSNSVAKMKLWTEDAHFRLRLEDGAGFKDFPIYSGVVTPALLPMIERGSKDLSAFDGEVDVSWNLNRCSVDPNRPFLVSCNGLGEISIPKSAPFVVSSFSTSTSQIERLDLSAQAVNFDFSLSSTGSVFSIYFLTFPFDRQHCTLQ